METRKRNRSLIFLILGLVLLSFWLHTGAPGQDINMVKFTYLNHFISFPIGFSLILYSMWMQVRERVNLPELSKGVRIVLGVLALIPALLYLLIMLRSIVGLPFDLSQKIVMWYEQYYCHMYGILVMLVDTLLINLSLER